MPFGLSNQFPTVITRDFTKIGETSKDEKTILELKGSLTSDSASYDKTDGQEMGILFSAKQNQTSDAANALAMILVDPVIDTELDHSVTSSSLVFKTVASGTLSTALTLSDGGLSISDVSFKSVSDNFIIQNTTSGGNITIDNQDATKNVIIILGSDDANTAFKVQGNNETTYLSVTGAGEVAIAGNLTVSGNTTTTTNTVIQDKLIELANGTTETPSGSSGIIIERGDENNVFFSHKILG